MYGISMPPRSSLPSPRQQQILQLIEQALRRHGRPPTRGELATALGLRNRQGIDSICMHWPIKD